MKKWTNLFVGFVGLMISGFAMASDGADVSVLGLLGIGAGVTMGIGAFGAASGQGKAASAALEGIARNPQAKAELSQPFVLGLVFMEFQALLSFVVAYMILGKV